jgi:hypothetical protein
MKTKTVCQLDRNGFFTGLTTADESPLEPGVFLLPAGAVDAPEPEHKDGFSSKWNGSGFVKVPVPGQAPEPVTTPPTVAELKAQALAQTRMERAPIVNVLDGMQASALVKGDTTRALEIETAKQGLKDLTKIDLSACVTAYDFKAKIMQRYREIAAALPADLRGAFAEALQ